MVLIYYRSLCPHPSHDSPTAYTISSHPRNQFYKSNSRASICSAKRSFHLDNHNDVNTRNFDVIYRPITARSVSMTSPNTECPLCAQQEREIQLYTSAVGSPQTLSKQHNPEKDFNDVIVPSTRDVTLQKQLNTSTGAADCSVALLSPDHHPDPRQNFSNNFQSELKQALHQRNSCRCPDRTELSDAVKLAARTGADDKLNVGSGST